ncbi:MAG TPA: response regulator transcription factor [Streptosporangiaceae bacterium]|nr:response regulator transcription factor [Streptosporangiaceae bacterium]
MIRVLVAEDETVMRDTLVALLGLEADIEVAVAVAAGDEVVSAAVKHRPDVAVLDVGMPGLDGISAADRLAGRVPGCRVLIFTGMAAPATVAAALRAGVSGYLLKDGSASELIAAVRAVANGERFMDARLG